MSTQQDAHAVVNYQLVAKDVYFFALVKHDIFAQRESLAMRRTPANTPGRRAASSRL